MDAYIGDVRGKIIVDVYYLNKDKAKVLLDISDASALQFDVTRQNGDIETWTCELESDTSMSYIIQRGFLPEKENIKLRPYVEWEDGSCFHGSKIILHVLEE
jgi:hypothetical protein